jgi:hypothetical protein
LTLTDRRHALARQPHRQLLTKPQDSRRASPFVRDGSMNTPIIRDCAASRRTMIAIATMIVVAGFGRSAAYGVKSCPWRGT